MNQDERVVEAVERLMVEAVGITAVALGSANPGVELSLPQWRALVVINASTRGVRIGDIAKQLGSAVPTTSRLVRRLERRGLVEANRDESDRRATLVRTTPHGAAVHRALVARRRALIQLALERSAPLAPDLVVGLEQISQALAQTDD